MVALYNRSRVNKLIIRATILIVLNISAFDLKCEVLEDDFFDMSLTQLAEVKVTSVAKKPQKISLAASSVFVLSQEDIRRSGVTTIADALRMVPGVQVAKLDANKWAISIRGFNDIFSNKLLILVDGRTVYSPFFGGAYWDTVDTILEDIDRIEVVRGPGGTLWGSNAVNGVINIITKNAKETTGLSVTALAGNEETGQLSMRYGGAVNKQTHYRVYAKGYERDEAEDGADNSRAGRIGFRVDSEIEQDKLSLLSEVYRGRQGERATPRVEIAPFSRFDSQAETFGAHVLFRWQRSLADNGGINFQAYYDRAERDHFYVSDKRNTFDLELNHRFQIFQQQELNWGLGFRYINDETRAGRIMSLTPEDRADRIYSAFIQDEISLIDERLILTLGTKVEHNSYTGVEYQPSARLLWKPYDKHSVWGSVSRAVRVPSRMEQDTTLNRTVVPPGLAINIVGSRDMEAEELLAYEIGYRFLDTQYSVDVSFFYNDYQRLRSLEQGQLVSNSVPFILSNELNGETYGGEISASWRVNQSWSLHGAYSFIQMQLHPTLQSNDDTEEADEGDTPQHQFSLRSFWQVSDQWQFDSTLRYVDMVRAASSTNKPAVDSYFTVDLRAAWKATDAIELSVVGQNLLGKHREFRGSTIDIQATDVGPSLYVKADLEF